MALIANITGRFQIKEERRQALDAEGGPVARRPRIDIAADTGLLDEIVVIARS
jgi:hypothetical protein